MDNENPAAEALLHQLVQLSPPELALPDTAAQLTEALAWLIAFAPGRLHRLFIKVDIPEKKVYGILLNTPSGEVARVLACALLDRLRQKWEGRQQFRAGTGESGPGEEERW